MSKGNPVIETERSIYFSQHYVWDNEFIYLFYITTVGDICKFQEWNLSLDHKKIWWC